MPGVLVRARRFEPSAFITYISQFPPRLELNAMCEPSGDQTGSQSMVGFLVRLQKFEPSGFITHISTLPSNRNTCAILLVAYCVGFAPPQLTSTTSDMIASPTTQSLNSNDIKLPSSGYQSDSDSRIDHCGHIRTSCSSCQCIKQDPNLIERKARS